MGTEGIDAIGSQSSVTRTEETNTASADERAEVSAAASETTRDEVRAQEDSVTASARTGDNFERTAQPAAPSGILTGTAAQRAELNTLADRMSATSPRARELIGDFRNNGGTFEPSEKGGYFDKDKKVIAVPGGSDEQRMQTMAHELGHYDYSKTSDGAYVPPGGPTGGITDSQIEQRRESNYITRNTDRRLADEAHATLTNNQIRNEMRASSGVDIGVAGDSAGKPMPFMPSAPFNEQRRVIGDFYGTNLKTSTTGENYRAYYNETYIKHYRENFLSGRQ
jgi:hypothetical protein